jgi:hypothetical protein
MGGLHSQSALGTHDAVERHARTTAGTQLTIFPPQRAGSTRQAQTTAPLVGSSAAKAGGEDGPAAEPVGRTPFERPERRPSKDEGDAPEEQEPETIDESERTHTDSREVESRVPSLMHTSLCAIVRHIPTAVLADNPFLERLAHSPGDWLLQAVVTHLLHDGLRRMNSGLWCGGCRRPPKVSS